MAGTQDRTGFSADTLALLLVGGPVATSARA